MLPLLIHREGTLLMITLLVGLMVAALVTAVASALFAKLLIPALMFVGIAMALYVGFRFAMKKLDENPNT